MRAADVSNLTLAFGLVPLAWLAGYRAVGFRLPVAWWLMAAAFAVSFVADMFSFAAGAPFVSQLYIIAQGALAAYAIAPRAADRFVPVLLVAAGVSLALRQGAGLDWLLHLTAWGGVAWLAWNVSRETLRAAVLVYFAGGALAWLWFVAAPGWLSWVAYQSTRAVGIGLWCAAVTLTEREGV